MLLSDLRGQNPAQRTLLRALESDRLAQAYLFEGPSGVGKERAALALAKAALCKTRPGRGCASCSICARIAAGNHPDVRVFRPRDEGSRNLPIQAVRGEILPFVQFAPFEAERALVILPQADVSFPVQHPEAANALLKTLEEPHAKLTFVLLAERPDRLLITIRSRCQRLRFGRLPARVLERILEDEGIAPERAAAAVALADGRADRALSLSREGLAEGLLERALTVDALLGQGKIGRLLELSEQLAKSADLALSLETLCAFYRDVSALALGVSRDRLFFAGAAPQLAERAAKVGAERAAARVQQLLAVPELLARNANPQIALDHLLIELDKA